MYGVLHDPTYRDKYAFDLKRELPRIPFYSDFWRWASWGKTLMDLHIGYQSAAAFKISRVDVPDERGRKTGMSPKPLLKSNREAEEIKIDTETTLSGVPSEAWDYKLGNRTALDWVLDQYKETAPKDPTIRARFNEYRFSDHKDAVIELLTRVATVSVETMRVVADMKVAGQAK